MATNNANMPSGITYYKLDSKYHLEGDVTKGCGLTGPEMDNNFLNLRRADVKGASWDNESKTLTIEKNDGSKIVVEDINPMSLSYDKETNTISGVDPVDGEFTVGAGVTSDSTIEGDGTIDSPLSIGISNMTGTYKPVVAYLTSDEFEDISDNMGNSETTPRAPMGGKKYYMYNHGKSAYLNSDGSFTDNMEEADEWEFRHCEDENPSYFGIFSKGKCIWLGKIALSQAAAIRSEGDYYNRGYKIVDADDSSYRIQYDGKYYFTVKESSNILGSFESKTEKTEYNRWSFFRKSTIKNAEKSVGDRYIIKENVNTLGALYSYNDVLKINEHLKGTGWRVATFSDWNMMLNAIEDSGESETGALCKNHGVKNADGSVGEGQYAGIYLKSDYEWIKPNEDWGDVYGMDLVGFTVRPMGFVDETGTYSEDSENKYTYYWAIDEKTGSVYAKRFSYDSAGVKTIAINPDNSSNCRFAIRLVKDNNYAQFETVNGIEIGAVRMSSWDNIFKQPKIWSTRNLSVTKLGETSLDAYIPSDSDGVVVEQFYIIQWDGFEWKKHEINEGETVCIKYPIAETRIPYREYNEYRVIKDEDGSLVLVNDTEAIYEKVEGIEGINAIDVTLNGENVPSISLKIKSGDYLSQSEDGLEFDARFKASGKLGDDIEVVSDHGDISKGTKASVIKGYTVSEILEKVLFPEVSVTKVAPSLKLTKKKDYILVGETFNVSEYVESAYTDGYYVYPNGDVQNANCSIIYENNAGSNLTDNSTIGLGKGGTTMKYVKSVSYTGGTVPTTNYGNQDLLNMILAGTVSDEVEFDVCFQAFWGYIPYPVYNIDNSVKTQGYFINTKLPKPAVVSTADGEVIKPSVITSLNKVVLTGDSVTVIGDGGVISNNGTNEVDTTAPHNILFCVPSGYKLARIENGLGGNLLFNEFAEVRQEVYIPLVGSTSYSYSVYLYQNKTGVPMVIKNVIIEKEK